MRDTANTSSFLETSGPVAALANPDRLDRRRDSPTPRLSLHLALVAGRYPVLCLVAVAAGMGGVLAQPLIKSDPSPVEQVVGGPAVFTVIASSAEPLSYQWRKGPTVLTGATNDTLIFTNVQPTDAGPYSVEVSNTSGSVASDEAILAVRWPRAGDVDFSFAAGSHIDGAVKTVVVQADGRILIAGDFGSVAGALRGRVARLNRNGSTDHTFGRGLSGADGSVNAMVVQADGKILIGGRFAWVNGVSRGGIARLNTDGSLDTGFLKGLGGVGDVQSGVNCLVAQADGKILIGGWFTSVNGVSRGGIARLNVDGSLDTDFLNGLRGANGGLASVTVQADGKILIGGRFTSVNGVTRGHLARLNADGSLDTGFLDGVIGVQDDVSSIAVQADGKVVIGGVFTSVNGRSRNHVARLNVDGSVDSGFLRILSGADGPVNSVAVQADGKVLIGGNFTSVNGVGRGGIARLNVDGSLDTGFLSKLSEINGWVSPIAVEADGSVLIGGGFTSVNGVVRDGLARLNADGSLQSGFLPPPSGPNNSVHSLAWVDGSVLVGGNFTSVSGIRRGRIARLNPDGSPDAGFLSNLSGADDLVRSLAVQADGKVLIGGDFTFVNGVFRQGIARLSTDGGVDTGFAEQSYYSRSAAVAVQADGTVLFWGPLDSLTGQGRIGRLTAYGRVLSIFGESDLPIYSATVQTDGRILIGGLFGSCNRVARLRIARLHPDGSLDTGFLSGLSGVNNAVRAMAQQADGKILIGGDFTSVNGVGRNKIARLNADGSLDTDFLQNLSGADSTIRSLVLLADGRILIGGDFAAVNGIRRSRIARLNTDGSLDTGFLQDLSGADDTVYSLTVQADGNVLICGRFRGVNGSPAAYVARLYGAAVVPRPTLSIEQIGSQARLRWPGDAAGYTLESTVVLTPPDWRVVAAPIQTVDGRFQVEVLATNHSQFFRLRKP